MGSAMVRLSLPDGTTKEVPATPVSVIKSEELWSKCELEDGSIIRVKPIVGRALRTSQYDNEGNPIYQVLVGNVVFVDAAQNLRRKKGL